MEIEKRLKKGLMEIQKRLLEIEKKIDRRRF